MLVPMFDTNPEFRKFAVILDKVVGELRQDLDLLNQPGRNLTVADLLANDPALASYLQVYSTPSSTTICCLTLSRDDYTVSHSHVTIIPSHTLT